jgi:hypothetical protein
LFLFTSAIVSSIEAAQQTLNVTLEAAYTHVFVSIEVLTWIRSISVVLIIVAHAMRHVQIAETNQQTQPVPAQPQTEQLIRLEITPELIEALRQALTNVTVVEETPKQQQIPERTGETNALDTVLHELDSMLSDVSKDDITTCAASASIGIPAQCRRGRERNDL